MDPKDVAAQQAKLAQHRAQQNHTKSDHQPTSAAKSIAPEGQIKAPRAVKRDFERAHDHAIAHGEKTDPLVSPQIREQDAARVVPSGMNGPTAPRSTGPEVNRDAYLQQLRKTNEQAKARQEQANRDMYKDGKDHD